MSDVTHVVDAGYVKELRFDPANGGNSSLQEVFISRAAAQQRAGMMICSILLHGIVICCDVVLALVQRYLAGSFNMRYSLLYTYLTLFKL